ncbi:uncharacterized, partial [Tachysurus ichikawai]
RAETKHRGEKETEGKALEGRRGQSPSHLELIREGAGEEHSYAFDPAWLLPAHG